MVEIPGITVPNIRAVLCVQNRLKNEKAQSRREAYVSELMLAALRGEGVI